MCCQGFQIASLLPHILQMSLGHLRAAQGKISFLCPSARWFVFPEISLNITDPLWPQKNLWSLNHILLSQRWRWNRVRFFGTEGRLWVVKHTWPYLVVDCSVHREAQVPGGKHKSVKKELWNKIMFCLETEQKLWLILWNTGMVCYFLWTSKVYVCLWWRW